MMIEHSISTPEINRRCFLLHTATAGAALAVAVPAVAAESEMTTRERVIWHMRELERLIREDGGTRAVVQASGIYTSNEDCRFIGIHLSGRLTCDDNMFAPKGGAS
ncbi:hypothetical protein [Mesorhizobium sp. A623]